MKLLLIVSGGLAVVVGAGILISALADRLLGPLVRPVGAADCRVLIRGRKVWKWSSNTGESHGSRIYSWWGGDMIFLLVGSPFFAAGAVMFLLLLKRVVSPWERPDSWSEAVLTYVFLTAVACALTTVGAACLFYREGTILDKSSGIATVWWNLLWWHRSKSLPLLECRKVELRHISTVKRVLQYSLLLKADDAELRLISGPEQRIMPLAETCARFLDLPLETSGTR